MAVLETGRSRIQSAFAAGERAIRRMEKEEQQAAIEQGRKERLAYDATQRQRVADARRQDEIRRKAGVAEEDRRMRRDLIQTIARGKGQGMFGARVPRINKFILHAPEMEKDAKGNLVKASEISGETRIDPGHVEKLRKLASLTRDGQAAQALSLHRTGKPLEPRIEKALADLGSDDFPEFTRMAMAAPIFEGDPTQEVGPLEVSGFPAGPTGGPAPQQFPQAEGDIDLTQLLSKGIIGPPPGTTPETFQPGFEQGFQGMDEPAAPLENIHELIQSGMMGNKAAGGTNKLQQEIEALESSLGRRLTEKELLTKGRAIETKGNIFEQLGHKQLEEFAKSKGLGTGTATAAPAAPTPRDPAPKAKAPAKQAGRKATSPELAQARQNFLEDNPGRAIQSITQRGGQIVIVDDLGEPWFSPIG